MVAAYFGKVIICIDELDKVLEVRQAREFLRKIKGVFSISDTYYIVSVSEEALEAFKLRNILGKDEVDSTFTTIYRLHNLSVDESKKILRQRGINIPEIEAVLAVLSAGIPRDLVRLARTIHLTENASELSRSSLIETTIREIISEVTENVRSSLDFSYEAKAQIAKLVDLLEVRGTLQIVTALHSEPGYIIYIGARNVSSELSHILLRLATRLEILVYLALHTELFDDSKMCSSFQQALALVPLSPLEAQRLFCRLEYEINRRQKQ